MKKKKEEQSVRVYFTERHMWNSVKYIYKMIQNVWAEHT